MTTPITVPTEIRDAIDAGALFVISHSGGKDSQAMAVFVRDLVPDDQIVVIHAHLPEVEWRGAAEHAEQTCPGLEFRTVQARKTFFEMVEHRGMFPSPSYRQCTSDLKRDPINKEIRAICRDRGIQQVVVCMGLRAEESPARARQTPLRLDKRMSVAGRTVTIWLPIHDLTSAEVFGTIASAGQEPHWAYAAGMSRLSCCFCIMASQGDLTTAARLNPTLYRRYVETERRLNFTLRHGQTLEETTGIAAP